MAWSNDNAPAPLVAGVNWWLDQSGHKEDVVMLAEDGMDALILSGYTSVDGVAWVSYDGLVRSLTGEFRMVHMEEDE